MRVWRASQRAVVRVPCFFRFVVLFCFVFLLGFSSLVHQMVDPAQSPKRLCRGLPPGKREGGRCGPNLAIPCVALDFSTRCVELWSTLALKSWLRARACDPPEWWTRDLVTARVYFNVRQRERALRAAVTRAAAAARSGADAAAEAAVSRARG